MIAREVRSLRTGLRPENLLTREEGRRRGGDTGPRKIDMRVQGETNPKTNGEAETGTNRTSDSILPPKTMN